MSFFLLSTNEFKGWQQGRNGKGRQQGRNGHGHGYGQAFVKARKLCEQLTSQIPMLQSKKYEVDSDAMLESIEIDSM